MHCTSLSPPYRWRIETDAAFLDFNWGNVATIRRHGRRFRTCIKFRQHVHEGTCGSIQQGVYFIESWLLARGPGALPGGGKVHWYELPPKLPPDLMALYRAQREGRTEWDRRPLPVSGASSAESEL